MLGTFDEWKAKGFHVKKGGVRLCGLMEFIYSMQRMLGIRQAIHQIERIYPMPL